MIFCHISSTFAAVQCNQCFGCPARNNYGESGAFLNRYGFLRLEYSIQIRYKEHTGVAYLFYFASVKGLKGQTVAIISYLDPIVAVILSFIVEKSFSFPILIGAVVIILSAIISELFGNKNIKASATQTKV